VKMPQYEDCSIHYDKSDSIPPTYTTPTLTEALTN
jgi:hypothetical protein